MALVSLMVPLAPAVVAAVPSPVALTAIDADVSYLASGRVLLPNGSPASGVVIESRHSSGPVELTRTAADGTWEFATTGSGPVSIRAVVPQGSPLLQGRTSRASFSSNMVVLQFGSATAGDMTLVDWASGSGRVSIPAAYRGKVEVTVEAHRPDGGDRYFTTTVADDGSYDFGALYPSARLRFSATLKEGDKRATFHFQESGAAAGRDATLPTVGLSALELNLKYVGVPFNDLGHGHFYGLDVATGERTQFSDEELWENDGAQTLLAFGNQDIRFEQYYSRGVYIDRSSAVTVRTRPGQTVTVPDFSFGAARGRLILPAKTPRPDLIMIDQWDPVARSWSTINGDLIRITRAPFELPVLAPGRYRIEAQLPGTYRSSAWNGDVATAPRKHVFTVEPRRTTQIRFTESLRKPPLGKRGLRIKPWSVVAVDAVVEAVHATPRAGNAEAQHQYQWWIKRPGKKAVKLRATTARGAGLILSSRHRGARLQSRLVVDGPLVRRTVFRSPWSVRVR